MNNIKGSVLARAASIGYWLYSFFRPTVNVMSIDDTLDTLVSSDKSLVRFGDGEITLICGSDLKLQTTDSDLAADLQRILKYQYDGLIVSVPDIFSGVGLYRDESRSFWKEHLLSHRKIYRKYCDRKRIYGNSFITRCYYIFSDKSNCTSWFRKFKNVWNDRKIVIVEGERSHSGVGNDLFEDAVSVERIICPAHDAYKVKGRIIEACRAYDAEHIFLLALGPTAKPIAEQLFLDGYRVIDIGNLDLEYEWYLHREKKKVTLAKHDIIGEEANRRAGYSEYLEQIKTSISL